MMKRFLLSFYAFLLFAGDLHCGDYPLSVVNALEYAGENRPELESVITYFSQQEDPLKLQAAHFLIGNMKGHSYITYALQDSAGKEVYFNILDYPDFQTLQTAWDSLDALYGEIDFKKKDIYSDLETISSKFLIDQIEYAFKTWREKPWAKELSFEQFCEYVLPYRGSNEPLESWREFFWKRYLGIEQKVADPVDAISVASRINDDLKSWFRFDPRYYYHPTDQGYSEMLADSLGRCEDMTNLTIYAMRANGLAVTSDYTPYWADSGNNHAWNAIVSPDGRVIPFMGAECNPGEYRLPNKMAKVYRKMYSRQKGTLASLFPEDAKLPRYLSGESYRDVTSDYVDVSDVAIFFTAELSDSAKVAYLCVFNSGEWKAIAGGKIENNIAYFQDMGVDIAYLPARYEEDVVAPEGAPFILQKDGAVRMLLPDHANLISIQVTSTTQRKQEVTTDGIAKVFLTPGKSYELSYWDDGWKSIGRKTAGEGALIFEKVPNGALYWLVEEDSDKEERIFTIEDGKQVWW